MLDDKDLSLSRWILPEFVDFIGRSLEKIASASVALLASELVFFNFLALNIPQASSWLNHGLMTIAKMLGPKVQDLILLSVKLL